MPNVNPENYLPVEEYREILGVFQGVAGLVLFDFARAPCESRDVIIRNFIARARTICGSVFTLWDRGDQDDCWVLHRCLLDRLFHLWHITERDEFEVFEAWSFVEQFNARNRVRSDPECRDALNSPFFSFSAEELARARLLAEDRPRWRRPRPEDAAKELQLGMLYRLGYDFASSFVHPMANDGLRDFFQITKLEPAPKFPDQRSVLSNTLLIGTMLIQQGLNASTLRWRRLVFDFFDNVRRDLGDGGKRYRESFLRIGKFSEAGMALGERSSGQSPA
jgi:hypothetical protein